MVLLTNFKTRYFRPPNDLTIFRSLTEVNCDKNLNEINVFDFIEITMLVFILNNLFEWAIVTGKLGKMTLGLTHNINNDSEWSLGWQDFSHYSKVYGV